MWYFFDQMCTSYARLSSCITLDVPQVNCIFLEYTLALSVPRKKQVASELPYDVPRESVAQLDWIYM